LLKDLFIKKMPTFLTFGSLSYTNTLARIRAQAEALPFTSVVCVTEDELKAMPELWEKHHAFVESNPRGYGYWIWKSYLTWKTLREMEEDDILVYADAGCTLRPDPPAFESMFTALRNCNGIAAVSLPYPEHEYCKTDLAIALHAMDYLSTPQYHASFFALRRTPDTVRLVESWYNTMCDYHLIDDTPSVAPNSSIFNEHRHDQATFSLLRKMVGVGLQLTNHPIDDTRIRTCEAPRKLVDEIIQT